MLQNFIDLSVAGLPLGPTVIALFCAAYGITGGAGPPCSGPELKAKTTEAAGKGFLRTRRSIVTKRCLHWQTSWTGIRI